MAYKIYADGVVFSNSKNGQTLVINPVVNLEENKAGSFKFTVPPTHPHFGELQERKTEIRVLRDTDEQPLFVGYITDIQTDFYKQMTYTCEGDLAYLNNSVQRQAHYTGRTSRQLLEAYISNHNAQMQDSKRQFTVGTVTAQDSNNSITCFTNFNPTMQEIKEDLVDDIGGILRVRYDGNTKYLDYLAEAPRTAAQVVKIGKNLLDLVVNRESLEVLTAVIPLGCRLENQVVEGLDARLGITSVTPGGVDYVYDSDAVAAFGWIFRVETWDNVTQANILKTKAEKYLQANKFSNIVIEASAIDLSLTAEQMEAFRLSDNIRVVSEPHGLDSYFRLTKMTVNLNDPDKDRITLGKTQTQTLTARTAGTATTVKEQKDEILQEALEEAKENATQIITTASNGYVTFVYDSDGHPEEILIMDAADKATAQKVWRWNVNGLGYSNTGYDGQYGLAITMDGAIVADYITAGTLNAARISSKAITRDKIADGAISSGQIASGAVTGTQIANGAVDTGQLASNAVTSGKIAGSAITSGKIAAQAVGETNIQDGAISTDKLQANSVTALQIAAGAVTADAIAAGAITTNKISIGSVTSEKIAENAVTGTQIASGAVGSSQIASGAVGTSKIASGAVTNSQIAVNAVGSNNIQSGAVGTSKIADSAVTSTQIANGAVGSTKIENGAVLSYKLADEAVTPAKIAAQAVTRTKIYPQAVGVTEIEDGCISTDKIAANAITTQLLAANCVTSAEIAANAVTAGKISVSELASLNATIGGWTISNNDIAKTRTSGLTVQNMWLSTSATNAINLRISEDGGSTYTSYFSVSWDGTLRSINADISGKITASSGAIGGWNISEGKLQAYSTIPVYPDFDDFATLQEFVAGTKTPTAAQKAVYDFNGDGQLTAQDVLALKRYLLNITPQIPGYTFPTASTQVVIDPTGAGQAFKFVALNPYKGSYTTYYFGGNGAYFPAIETRKLVGNVRHEGNITLPNTKSLLLEDSGGTSYNGLTMDASGNTTIGGYGNTGSTYIYTGTADADHAPGLQALVHGINPAGTAVNRGLVMAPQVNTSGRLIGFDFRPSITHNATNGYSNLGTSSYRFTRLYAAAAEDISSDQRLKDHLFYTDEEDRLQAVFRKLRPVCYSRKGMQETEYGFYAQEVQAAFDAEGVDGSAFVRENEDGYLSMTYQSMTALNTHMIQRLLEENDNLQKRLADIEAKLADLCKK